MPSVAYAGGVSSPWVKYPGQTSYRQIADFVRRKYGAYHPILSRIMTFNDFAALIVSLDPYAGSISKNLRPVVLREDRLWLVRGIDDLAQTIFFTEALKHMKFDLPALRIYAQEGHIFTLQELLVRAMPCFLGRELKGLAPIILPAILAAHGTEPQRLNLTLEKFLTHGPKKIFVGLRPLPERVPWPGIAEDLLRAGLIDPRRGAEQFVAGLRLAKGLDRSDFKNKVLAAMIAAHIPRGEADALLEKQAAFRREKLVHCLEVLVAAALDAERMIGERLKLREELMIGKEMLLPTGILPHVAQPQLRISDERSSAELAVIADKEFSCRTGYQRIAAFLQRFYGYDSPGKVGIVDIFGLAMARVTLDRADPADYARQVVLKDDKLWIVREIADLAQTIYYAEALKFLGIESPPLEIHRRGDRTFAFQEYLVLSQQCFFGPELAPVAGRALPAVLAAQAMELGKLNLQAGKFLTMGARRIFTGLQPRRERVLFGFVVDDLLEGGLIDPARGIDQFAEGIAAVTVLDSPEFKAAVAGRLRAAGLSDPEIESYLEGKSAFRREHFMEDLQHLVDLAKTSPPPAREKVAPRIDLVGTEVLPHVAWPEVDVVAEVERKITDALAGGVRVSMDALVEKIIERGARIVRIEGGTARGKTTYINKLVAALRAKNARTEFVNFDELFLRPPAERAPIKQMIAHAAGLGFISTADEQLSFHPERARQIIAGLDFEQRREYEFETYPGQAVENVDGCRPRKKQRIKFVLDPETILVLEGKFYCWPRYWEGQKASLFTVLLYLPHRLAEARAARRAEPGFAREQEALVSAMYDPSHFKYLGESGLLDRTDAVIETGSGEIYLL